MLGAHEPDTTPVTINHPCFSRLYPFTERALNRIVGKARQLQNAQVAGRTLIIGAGTGLDVPVLGAAAGEVVLLEPDATMRRILFQRYPHLTSWAAAAETIPSPADTFDTVLSSLVLCSVADVDRVLHEITRVLKPDGQYLFMEHVRSPRPAARFAQSTLEPVWRRFAGGCHLTRDVEGSLRRSRLRLTHCEAVRSGGIMPVIRGRAVSPDG